MFSGKPVTSCDKPVWSVHDVVEQHSRFNERRTERRIRLAIHKMVRHGYGIDSGPQIRKSGGTS